MWQNREKILHGFIRCNSYREAKSQTPQHKTPTLRSFFSEKEPQPHVSLSLFFSSFALENDDEDDAIVPCNCFPPFGHVRIRTEARDVRPWVLFLVLAMEEDKYAKELEVAVRVVHVACALCGRVQERFLATNNDHVLAKGDDSPVTVAGIKCIQFQFQF